MAKAGGALPPQEAEPFLGIPALPPLQDPYNPPQPYILVPVPRTYRRRQRRTSSCTCCDSLFSSSSALLVATALLLLAASLFFLWPSDPEIHVDRLDLDHIRVITSPAPVLDVSMNLKLSVRNPDFFSLDYDSLLVSIAYRGKQLGFVTSGGGRIRARGVSYIDANLKLNGIQVIQDVFYLIEDLARGSIPFDTITQVDGTLQVFFVGIPIQGRISCAVNINPINQSVIRQDCYPA